MSILLQIDGLRKRFGQRLLLDIDHLQLDAGAAYVLTGANGAGKSTLLRVLCGLEQAEVGRLVFMGQPLRLSPYPREMREAIAYVHQHPVMFSTSVADNIAYGLKGRGLSREEICGRVDEAIAWAGIGHLRGSPPRWRGPGCCGPGCCCSMSRPPTSTAPRAKR
jgi:tungstate transport system ATP-binding protein